MKNVLAKLALVSFALLSSACSKPQESVEPSSGEPQVSSVTPVSSEAQVSSVTPTSSQAPSSAPAVVDNQLSNSQGLVVKFNKTGAKIDSINVGNKKIAENGFTVGRCANRIANGKFTLSGTEYNVTKNDGNHSLHGGGRQWSGTFANSNWTKVSQDASSIKFSFHSADKADGYPGNMDMTVTYSLNDKGDLSIEYSATSDKDTLCNPTNHLYMSLNGSTSYSGIKLWIDADNYTPLSNKLPTGDISPVVGTQFDYSSEKAFDSSKSYDDNYVLKANPSNECRKVATMTGSVAKVDVYTDRAGLQLYKENNGKICLETQQFPDAINHPNFLEYGTTILKAGETFKSKTIYHFELGEQ